MANLDAKERLAALRGGVTGAQRDPALQAIVREAADQAGTPLALVSLIMGTIQLFRADHGLPPELGVSLATSRCDSFCQFVVQTEAPFVVRHASEDARVPQTVVQSHSVQAYVGVPVRVDGQIVGTLCVLDVQPREFGDEVAAALEPLAARASARLQELADAGARGSRGIDGGPPRTLGEAVEAAADLGFRARLLERAMVEVGPLTRVGQALGEGTLSTALALQAAELLTEAAPVFELLVEEARQLRHASARLHEALESLHAGTDEEGA
ncbi:response regulator [Plesiocystis pacifica SIR-1]|uniref:Response regulator n=1 Tax=Plesiocystis pacifica SIR-1 TaxID=391625 RepID=A6G258_9BACT|nr:GAF domain-containing protein [Plesiocystis pacifica]EDM80027.1 response regulator [Plesiocystis pacifica SIR-1]